MDKTKIITRLSSKEFIVGGNISVKSATVESYPLHWHNYFEIEIITDGNAKHIYNGTQYEISKGDAYILTPVDFHEIPSADKIGLINISFDSSRLPENVSLPDIIKNRKLPDDEYKRFICAANLLKYECENNGNCINQLLEYIINFFAVPHKNRPQNSLKQEHLNGINKAISYIELHFREKISLNQIAGLSGYNPTYFSELFCKATGETYTERLKTLRINYAKMLLTNGISVSDACFASGFGSLSNFLSTFKARCGQTPSEYRKKHI